MKILEEIRIPDLNGKIYILRVVEEEKINVLEFERDELKFRIELLGYTANYLLQIANSLSVKFSSLNYLLPGYSQPIENIQPPRASTAPVKRTFGPKSSNPPQFNKEISVDEAINIILNKSSIPDEMVKVKLDIDSMIKFIFAYKKGSEIYVRGETNIFKQHNLFIEYKLFNEALKKLLNDKIISERHKTSQKGDPYSVFVIPREIPIEYQNNKTPTKIETKQENVPPVLKSATDLIPSTKDILEDLFVSFSSQEAEFDLELFVSEAQFKKISREESVNFFNKKIEERNKQYRQKKQTSSDTT